MRLRDGCEILIFAHEELSCAKVAVKQGDSIILELNVSNEVVQRCNEILMTMRSAGAAWDAYPQMQTLAREIQYVSFLEELPDHGIERIEGEVTSTLSYDINSEAWKEKWIGQHSAGNG